MAQGRHQGWRELKCTLLKPLRHQAVCCDVGARSVELSELKGRLKCCLHEQVSRTMSFSGRSYDQRPHAKARTTAVAGRCVVACLPDASVVPSAQAMAAQRMLTP